MRQPPFQRNCPQRPCRASGVRLRSGPASARQENGRGREQSGSWARYRQPVNLTVTTESTRPSAAATGGWTCALQVPLLAVRQGFGKVRDAAQLNGAVGGIMISK